MEDTFTFTDMEQKNTTAKEQFMAVVQRLIYLSEFNKDQTKTHLSVSYLTFVRTLITRLPVCPICSINGQNRIVLSYEHDGDTLTITVLPARTVMVEKRVKDGNGNYNTLKTTGIARPDYIGQIIQDFYEGGTTGFPSMNITFRKATPSDYGFISTILQTQKATMREFKVSNMYSVCTYAYVAVDPYLGPLSFAILRGDDLANAGTEEEIATFQVEFIYTNPLFRGLGFAEKCLRGAMKVVNADYPDAKFIFEDREHPSNFMSSAHSLLKRIGFVRTIVHRGRDRYSNFQNCCTCPLYNTKCRLYMDGIPCNTVIYVKK